ncbi:MAG: hydantoinase B/oxoprolinase family protein [Planctomycetaceae bacterium]|nr:hydantoinase B/oxoprolinase family protein [Planctomycetaceae bacterium]
MSHEHEKAPGAGRWQFWIDVGGTFTDCVARTPVGELRTWKTLSSGIVKGVIARVDPPHTIFDPLRQTSAVDFWKRWKLRGTLPKGAAWESVVLGSDGEGHLELADPFPSDLVGQAYELLCEENAPLVCVRSLLGLRLDQPIPAVDIRLGTTRGTNALLERKGARTVFLVTKGFRDLLRIGNQDRPDLFALEICKPEPLYESVIEVDERITATGAVLKPLDENRLRKDLERVKTRGIEAVAICLLHAYRNDRHERHAASLAEEMGFACVSRSSSVAPVIKAVSRGETTVLDAYLTPILRDYLAGIQSRLGKGSTLKVMTSYGGLIDASEFSGKDSILSGPAGGVVALAAVSQEAGFEKCIGFDMGGTSTDVARVADRFDFELETTKAGVRIAVPTLAIETVAAGGGSVCAFDGVQLRVGPESAGADPGPACYGRGGPMTVTDANVFLGRVPEQRFPFPLDRDSIRERLQNLREAIAESPSGRHYGDEELAQGFLDIANERMSRAVRTISIQKGFHPKDHLLVSFGGAGGQHACAIARMLDIPQILIHPFAGILSAYGMGLADIRKRREQTILKTLSEAALEELKPTIEEFSQTLRSEVQREGIELDRTTLELSLGLRYAGVENVLDILTPEDGDWHAAYERQHKRLYGYTLSDRQIQIVTLNIEAVGRLRRAESPRLEPAQGELEPSFQTNVWFDGEWQSVPTFSREQLRAGHQLVGPAVICDEGSTIWIEPGFQATIQPTGSLLIKAGRRGKQENSDDSGDPDPIQLEVFNNQFASIAEQMGEMLRKTSVSTNVKERLDYSCALFDARGGLVVNAPHIPVHLGAMGETIRCLLRDQPDMRPGDVCLTNDPFAGGSHLPDLTVVTPVFAEDDQELLFLTASRAHHAEIGGLTPGSMPPFSTNLAEEGILLRNFKLIDQGTSRWEELRNQLTSGPYPSRNVEDNVADLSAQVAANRLGGQLLQQLIQRSGRWTVLRYMRHIQDAAELKMRRALDQMPDGRYVRTDHLDQGAPIAVTITINGDAATIDFTGTGPVLENNLNANRAIVTAAVMYVFRCLIDEPIPLNSGVLKPLTIVLPECLLNPPAHADPAKCAAVVGGNVETSQRVVDVLLGALKLAAASQGTMNNLTFGDGTFGYYETICGGAGATSNSNGADAVHTHMTNTRLTDVEVLEHRYPVRVEEFSIRRGSGGQGLHAGGNGIRRVFRFLKPLQVSLLTQRRGPFSPFGLEGG